MRKICGRKARGQQDKKILKRINTLLQDIDHNGYTGMGKPEPLK